MSSKNNKTVLAFGELMLRHSVNDIKDITELDKADKSKFEDSYGGSEANVLAALQGLGVNTRFFTALPYTKEGEGAIKFLQSYNIDTNSILVGGEKMGTYYVATNCTDRALATKYDRDDASITLIDPKKIDYDSLFSGVDLFHFSGVNLALKGNTRQVCEDLLFEAKKRGIKVSFDFNYRENLWKKDNTPEGIKLGQEEASRVFQDVVPYCDYVFAAHRDLTGWFDFDGPIQEFLHKYPRIEKIITRDKKQLTPTTKEATAGIYTKDDSYELNPPKKFNVKENIGGGDAYDAGILYGLLNPEFDLEKTVKFGIECYALKHQIKGDIFKGISKNQVEASMNKNENANEKI